MFYKVYDLLYDEKPGSLKEALDAYKEALKDESAEELKEQLTEECHYVMEPELTYTYFVDAARNNSFNREQLQKGFNNIEQSDTIASLIKEIDKADLLNSDAEILGNAYEYLIGQFASETGKKAGEFYTLQAVSKILTKIAISGQEERKGLSVYDPCMGSGSLLLNAKKYAAEPGYIKYYGQELNTSTYNLHILQNGVPQPDFRRMKDSVIMAYWLQNQKQIMYFYYMVCIISRIMGLWLSYFPMAFFSEAEQKERLERNSG